MAQYSGHMEVEAAEEFYSMMNYLKGSVVSVQSFAKSGNQHPLRPSNIADCQALHKRCTLVFSLVSGSATSVSIDVTGMFPGEEQPLLHLCPTLSGQLVTSDTFTLMNPGDYHEIEFVPKYRKHHRSHRPHYNVLISIDGEPAFQWHTVVHHPGYAKQSDDSHMPVELQLETGPDIDGVNFGLFPYERRELDVHQPSASPVESFAAMEKSMGFDYPQVQHEEPLFNHVQYSQADWGMSEMSYPGDGSLRSWAELLEQSNNDVLW